MLVELLLNRVRVQVSHGAKSFDSVLLQFSQYHITTLLLKTSFNIILSYTPASASGLSCPVEAFKQKFRMRFSSPRVLYV
jgi:hypothetical protein